MREEIGKAIENYIGSYQVSNKGRVRSLDRVVDYGNRFVRRKGIILKLMYHRQGYLCVGLKKNNTTKTFKVHRLVGGAFILNTYNKCCINHIYGIKDDNDLDRLEVVTSKENAEHAKKTGLNWTKEINRARNKKISGKKHFCYGKFGEEHCCSKFLDEQVKEAKYLRYIKNYPYFKIAGKLFYHLPEINPLLGSKEKYHLALIKHYMHIYQLHCKFMLFCQLAKFFQSFFFLFTVQFIHRKIIIGSLSDKFV